MKTRLLSLCLAAVLLLSALPAAQAKVADVPEGEKAVVLAELEILVGDETGDLHLDRAVTRAEFTKLAVCASVYKDSVGESAATDPYPDVSHKDWFAPYVQVAADTGLVKGDLAGWFHPQRTITLGEAATMATRLLGYADAAFSAPWPEGQLALYRSLELNSGLTAQKSGDELTRGDCLHLFYNLLTVSSQSGTPYIHTLGHTLNQEGEVDIPALFQVEREGPIPLTGDWESLLPFEVAEALIYRDNDRATLADLRAWDVLYWAKDQAILFAFSEDTSSMGQVTAGVEGPVVVESGWESQLPFPLSETASVTRNGAAAQLSHIQEGDLVYWSKYAKGLYVYRRRVSGTVEAVSPALASPTAVTVAGVTYPLETFAAQYAFSDLGRWRKGDRVTLLLGRGGGVAAVQPLEEDPAPQVGVIAALGTKTYTDLSDKPYTAKTVTLTATDGVSYTYPWYDEDLEVGDLVSVSWSDGEVAVQSLPSKPLTGTVNADATRLDRTTVLSPDLEVLDTYGDTLLATVPPSRIAGVTFTGNMVRYYTTDEDGTVTSLILNDVTGDLHTYGVLTDKETVSMGMLLQGTYTLNVGGQEVTVPVQNKGFSVDKGPVQLVMEGQEVKALKNLTALDNVTLSGQTAQVGGRRCTLSDTVSYYLYDKAEKEYRLVSRSQITGGKYLLSAWYDAHDAAGGRVRVVVAAAS